jgi:hypothetical protein
MSVSLPEIVQHLCGMSRSIVQNHKPEGIRVIPYQKLQMSLHFLVSLTLMNGIQAFTCGILQASQQSAPGILFPWSIYFSLFPSGNIAVANIWQPM